MREENQNSGVDESLESDSQEYPSQSCSKERKHTLPKDANQFDPGTPVDNTPMDPNDIKTLIYKGPKYGEVEYTFKKNN